jgi:O-antigen/teichoic acid export membrane protein
MIQKLARQNAKYLKQLSSNYLLMLVNYVVFFFLTPLMLNKLGKEQYSIWLLMSNIIMYFSLSNFGMLSTLTVEVPKVKESKEATDKLLNTVLISLLSVATFTFLVFIFLEWKLEYIIKIDPKFVPITQTTLFFFFLTFLVTLITGIFDNILIATHHIVKKNSIDILRTIAIGLSSITLIATGFSIIEVAVSNFIFTTAFFFATFYSSKKVFRFKVNFAKFDLDVLKKLLSPSWHYFIISIVSLFVFYSDNLLISKLKGVEYVALFAVMYRLSDVCLKIISKITFTKFPKILDLAIRKDYYAIAGLHKKLMLLNLAVAIPTCFVLFFFGIDILKLWLGNKYEFNISILRIYSVFTLFMVCAQSSAHFLNALEYNQKVSYMGVAEAILNIVLSYILFQYLDLTGIALGTLLAHLLTNGWYMHQQFYSFINSKLQQLPSKT